MKDLLKIKELYEEIINLEDNVTTMDEAIKITENLMVLKELDVNYSKILLEEELLIFFDNTEYIFINVSKNDTTKKIEVEKVKNKIYLTIFNENIQKRAITNKIYDEMMIVKIFEIRTKNKFNFYDLYNKINFINIKTESEDVKTFKLFYKNNLLNTKMEALKKITEKTKFRFEEVVSEYNNFINNNINLNKFNETQSYYNNDIHNYLFLYKEFKKLEEIN